MQLYISQADSLTYSNGHNFYLVHIGVCTQIGPHPAGQQLKMSIDDGSIVRSLTDGARARVGTHIAPQPSGQQLRIVRDFE